MKKPTLITLCLLLFVSFSYCQDDEMPESVTVVFSQNKCKMTDMGKLYEMTETMSGPVMSEVVEAGHWMNWGILSHDWGDEWNFNIYYVAKDKETFFKGWYMFVKLMGEKYPDSMEEYQSLIIAHKDNIYHQSMGHAWMKKDMEDDEDDDNGEE